ncbi:MAG TPA: fructose-6-phosphate aldolase [Syntrophorhabdaceae bacterium]|nr:fructose-6-phosphate aldolase [Syntrophorhabdaceae bacterium]HOT42342.1 fructose-6-phosphate aldolase [Syntrophorhabdaceae bacterium]HPC67393.1 fructose-6-phosphate aldolase [Syntrophorhabdaceae bacterium]HQE80535.1 fructose-6-phosphate aldolase [Syntrophorhabdaceae bacterium]HQH43883.1 fructose-6-phosphate aldolase [Syntrophorhabdaceae bacterium]
MKFFIDTANIDEIKKGIDMGLVDGVTTNPTLLSKEKKDPNQVIKEIMSIVSGPVSLEVISKDREGMCKEARQLAGLGENAVIKIPMTEEGIKAVRILSQEGIKTNVTLVFQPIQALIAAKAGATYVSPFIGRLDDISSRGMGIIEDITTIFNNYGFETEIIVASIRNPLHVLDAALLGADIATIPFNVLKQLISHPLTDIGLERFLKDWGSIQR